MAIFENPNSPIQPQPGVYGWYAKQNDESVITIYIGNAGGKRSFLVKGTLFRGVSELQRCTFTSNSNISSYSTLDTDFIVGTAIRYFESRGYSCFWKHISNNPRDEKKYILEQTPVLQCRGCQNKNGNIKDEFRLRKNEKDYWKQRYGVKGIEEAEEEIFSLLDRALKTATREASK